MSGVEDLTGQVVVVTGAASGIGAATAAALLAGGARVVAGDLRAESMHDLADEWGDQVVLHAGDVADPATADAMISAAVQVWGHLDCVVANAGVGYFGGLEDTSPGQIQTMTNTNFLGTVWLARSGVGGANEAVYAATKAAQIQFATSLAREVRTEGIRVSVIAPAAVNTHFAAATGRFGDQPPEQGDFLEPADVAAAIVTTLQQPRRLRTALWSLWSLAEPH
jgi:NADP-dependent 3-hydroxy acid dehydrogenase YdfG